MYEAVTAGAAADCGPLILGGLLAFGLSGCVNMQVVVYWQVYSDERWTKKFLVFTTWFLDLCHSAFIAAAIWDSVITPYGNMALLDTIPWSIGLTIELTAMLTFLVQSFFAYRIYRLQHRKVMVAGAVLILAFIRLGTATAAVGEMIKARTYIAFVYPSPSPIFILAVVGLCLSVLVDIMITAFLCYFLRSNRTKIPMSSTNRIIDTLTLWTVETGSATCIGTIASLVCLTAMPHNRVFLGLHFVVGKLYANSLLATLNARRKISQSQRHNTTSQMVPIPVFSGDRFRSRDDEDGPTSPEIQQYAMDVDPFGPHQVGLKGDTSKIEVNVQRMVESKYDDIVAIDIKPRGLREAKIPMAV